MRIIQHGDPNRLKKIKRFECGQCGCIFEAESTEYKHEFSQREMCGWYEAHCPTCHSTVTLSDETDAARERLGWSYWAKFNEERSGKE